MKIVNIKRAAVAAVSLTALLAVSACSGGGAPPATDTGGGGGGGNSGYTFAMVTHEHPGDTFWDRIRAGAEQAAKDTGSTLKYSADPEATKQATLIQGAIDAKVDGIATTLVTPDALIPTREEGRRPPASRSTASTRAPTSTSRPARLPTSPPMRSWPVSRPARRRRPTGRPRSCAPSSRPGRWPWRIVVPASRPPSRTPRTSRSTGGRLRGHLGDPGQARPGQGHQLDHHPRCGIRRSTPSRRWTRWSSSAKIGTFDLNKEAAEAVQGRQDPVLHRPAAVRAGLPGGAPSSTSDQEERQRSSAAASPS